MRTLLLTLTTCLLVLPVQAKYSGGSGTAKDPYQIATAADLIALGETPGDYDKHFVLTADIDLDPKLPGRKVFDRAVIAPDANDAQGDFQGTPFSGVFDGNGHAISHVTIKGSGYLGLFGQLAFPAAQVGDLGIVDVDITGSGDCAGALAGSGNSVTQCHSTGSVSGRDYIGGLVGVGGGETNCYSKCAVSGANLVGGLVGYSYLGSVTQCWSAGAVSGNDFVGGLVGGSVSTHVTQCYSMGAVSGRSQVGGLVGRYFCRLTWLDPGISNCYSASAIRGTGDSVGGLVGYIGCQSYGTLTSSFWDIQTSGQTTSAGGTGKTTAEMQTAKTFLEAGWDFVGEMANGSEDVWKISEGLGYPRLSWEKYSGGSGEPNDPYQIATAADLIALGETPADYGKHFILTADIDLDPNLPGRRVFDRAVIAPDTRRRQSSLPPGFQGTLFTGVFDGSGHTISHLTIAGSNFLGLFGQLESGAEVKDLGVMDVNVTSDYGLGPSGPVGGLVAYNGYGGIVSRCCSTGVVRGGGQATTGGVVGSNDGTVIQCYSTAVVTGDGVVGGLVGANPWGTVTQCYSTGAVRGTGGYVGGLVGGDWGHVTASFWDIQTSGQTTSQGGTGKTTAQMQTARTFLDAGWDFVGETANGTEDLWWILEGKDYPRLWWEAASHVVADSQD